MRREGRGNKKARARALRTQERAENLAGRCLAAHRALSPCTRTSHGVSKAAIQASTLLLERHVTYETTSTTRHRTQRLGGCEAEACAQPLALVHSVPLLCASLWLGCLTRPVDGLTPVCTSLALRTHAHPRLVRLPCRFQPVLCTVEEGGSTVWRGSRKVEGGPACRSRRTS